MLTQDIPLLPSSIILFEEIAYDYTCSIGTKLHCCSGINKISMQPGSPRIKG